MPELKDWDVQIIGTDLSGNAIQKASMGKYSQEDIQRGLPEKLRDQYFELTDDEHWQIKKLIFK